MKETLISDQLDSLRARIETSIASPGIVTVTSAERGDGTSLVALGLAERFAEAKYRVLFVDANTGNASLPDLPPVTQLALNTEDTAYPIRSIGGRFDAISLADSKLASKTPREMVNATTFSFRASYDYVVIDTGTVTHSPFAILFAAESDATLLALRSGRAATENDEQAIAALERVNATVLGVVSTHRDAHKHFEKTRAELNASLTSGMQRPAVASLPALATVRGEQNGRSFAVPTVSAERS